MMSEQLFVIDKLYYTIMTPIEKISVGRSYMTYREVVDCLNEQQSIINELKEENEQLLQQTKEYLQIKIDECKNPKKMEEIVFGVEQKVGYKKALLQVQKGLKRRLNDE